MCPPIDVKGLKEAPILTRNMSRVARVLAVLVCLAIAYGCVACCLSYYISWFSAPPGSPILESDLVGYWGTGYGGRRWELLVLCEDGLFRQGYLDYGENEEYITPWQPWTIERFPEGDVYVHLEGARLNRPGVRLQKELDLPFWDPYRRRSVYMRDKLILTVRRQPITGDIILMHMCSSRDSCYKRYFSRLSFWNWAGLAPWS